MLDKFISKKKERKYSGSHINDFRTKDYRVFYASSYFNIDLIEEINWHQKYIKKLHNHAKKPHLFHMQFHEGEIDEHRERHFREHVIDSIPFHRKILKDHQTKLKAILKFMSKIKYRKIVRICQEFGGTPEYFVYDKKNKKFFFVIEHSTKEKKHWKELVKEVHKICEVITLK